MQLSVLSERTRTTHVAWEYNFEFEDLVVELCGAALLTPILKPHSVLQRAMGKKPVQYQPLAVESGGGPGPRVLLAVAMTADNLGALLASVNDWRSRFDQVAAVVMDGWGSFDCLGTLQKLDRLFVCVPEALDTFTRQGVKAQYLPLACDVVRFGSGLADRPIDLVGYGRQPQDYHQAFSRAFNQPGSQRVYFHTTAASPQVRNLDEDRRLFWQLLVRCRVALAFDTLVKTRREFPFSVVTARWFECLAAGCAVVGVPPATPHAAELFPWENATIRLPDKPAEAVEFVGELLDNTPLLTDIAARNHANMLAHHDWRYRLETIFTSLGLGLPERLGASLDTLRQPRTVSVYVTAAARSASHASTSGSSIAGR